MDKHEIRRLNLRALMRDQCDDKAASLAARLDRSPSYVSRMLYEEGKPGKKRIGEDMAEMIERAFGLRKGALDTRMSEGADTKAAPEQSEGWSALVRVDATEHRILTLVQAADSRGRAEMLAAVEELAARGHK